MNESHCAVLNDPHKIVRFVCYRWNAVTEKRDGIFDKWEVQGAGEVLSRHVSTFADRHALFEIEVQFKEGYIVSFIRRCENPLFAMLVQDNQRRDLCPQVLISNAFAQAHFSSGQFVWDTLMNGQEKWYLL